MLDQFLAAPNIYDPEDPDQAKRYDLLRDSLQHVPGIVGMILLSGDGLPQAGYGLGTQAEGVPDKIVASCSGMASLSAHFSAAVEGGPLLRTLVQLARRTVVVSRCGSDSTIAVVIDSATPIASAVGEIERNVRAYAEHVSTGPRFPAA